MDVLRNMPPVTQMWLVGALAATACCYFGLSAPTDYACSWTYLFYLGTGWKGLFLTFFYLGPPSLSLAVNLYFLVAQASNYEHRPVDGGGGSAVVDFTWQLLFGMAVLLAATAVAEAVLLDPHANPFQALGLATYLRALWAFSNPYGQVNFYGQVLDAWKLPFASLAFQTVTQGTDGLMTDVVAAAAAWLCLLGLRHRTAASAAAARDGLLPGLAMVGRGLAAVACTPRWYAALLHLIRAAPPPPPVQPRPSAAAAAAPGHGNSLLGGFGVGDMVEVVGTSVEALNGRPGVVRAVIAATGRLQVSVLTGEGGRSVALKPANLARRRPAAPAAAAAAHEHRD